MFLLPRVSFRCCRFRCSYETAIELEVLLANKKLMFHIDLLEGMDRIVHRAQEREGRGRIICLSAGTIEEDDNKLGQVVTNTSLMSLKRQAVIKTGTSWNAV
jgi:hypothetical protein